MFEKDITKAQIVKNLREIRSEATKDLPPHNPNHAKQYSPDELFKVRKAAICGQIILHIKDLDFGTMKVEEWNLVKAGIDKLARGNDLNGDIIRPGEDSKALKGILDKFFDSSLNTTFKR